MKKIAIFAISAIAILMLGLYLLGFAYEETTQDQEFEEALRGFQNDADLLRLEHLVYWTGLVEEYHLKTGQYPFQEHFKSNEKIGFARIVTKHQQQFFTPTSASYRSDLDNNSDGYFTEFTVKDFISELEQKLQRNIDEKYDIQRYPTSSPIGYNYFVDQHGYLIWVTCISCGVTHVSTLLLDGYTPTVNIGSAEMVKDVTKAVTRQEMLNHPTFIEWQNKKYIKEAHIRQLEQKNIRDSKK